MPRGVRSTKTAPDPLSLVQALVNTKNAMRGYDLMANPASAAAWLAEVGFASPGLEPDADSLDHLRAVREALRDILQLHSDSPPQRNSDVTVVTLNQLVDTRTLSVKFSATGTPSLTASSRGVGAVTEDVLAAIVWAQHRGLWPRLKVCGNEACRWAFYDTSRNRSGHWCRMEVCGARAKMRTYRAKRSGDSPDTP